MSRFLRKLKVIGTVVGGFLTPRSPGQVRLSRGGEPRALAGESGMVDQTFSPQRSQVRRTCSQPLSHARILVATLLCALIAGCGESGPQTPQALQGKWGADCAAPFIQFDGAKIHVFPDDADYTVTKSDFDGKRLTLSYNTAMGPVTEIYSIDKDLLQLDTGHYRDMDVTWRKQPMKRCSA